MLRTKKLLYRAVRHSVHLGIAATAYLVASTRMPVPTTGTDMMGPVVSLPPAEPGVIVASVLLLVLSVVGVWLDGRESIRNTQRREDLLWAKADPP